MDCNTPSTVGRDSTSTSTDYPQSRRLVSPNHRPYSASLQISPSSTQGRRTVPLQCFGTTDVQSLCMRQQLLLFQVGTHSVRSTSYHHHIACSLRHCSHVPLKTARRTIPVPRANHAHPSYMPRVAEHHPDRQGASPPVFCAQYVFSIVTFSHGMPSARLAVCLKEPSAVHVHVFCQAGACRCLSSLLQRLAKHVSIRIPVNCRLDFLPRCNHHITSTIHPAVPSITACGCQSCCRFPLRRRLDRRTAQ